MYPMSLGFYCSDFIENCDVCVRPEPYNRQLGKPIIGRPYCSKCNDGYSIDDKTVTGSIHGGYRCTLNADSEYMKNVLPYYILQIYVHFIHMKLIRFKKSQIDYYFFITFQVKLRLQVNLFSLID